MIHVFINTKRVYSIGNDMTPKYEVIEQSVTDGANWKKFLKYFKFKGYVLSDLYVTKVWDSVKKEEIDIEKWQNELKAEIKEIGKEKPTVQDSLQKERERNDELMKRLELLEAQLGNKVPDNADLHTVLTKDYESMTDDELSNVYEEKFGKKPHHMAKRETIIEKLK